jgi:8-oxo-dGTP diphosphatase
VETELFMVTLRDTPQPDAEIDETAWIDPAAPPDIELAPLAEQTVLGLLRG